jgi:hypothetical protein
MAFREFRAAMMMRKGENNAGKEWRLSPSLSMVMSEFSDLKPGATKSL